MKKYQQLAEEIVQKVGGKENIISLVHCVTRLRFVLNDEARVNERDLESISGVIGVVKSSDQYQVVIGNHVPEVYKAVCEIVEITANEKKNNEKKMGLQSRIFDLLSGILMPAFALMCASGILKGINTILMITGLYEFGSSYYVLVDAIGDAMFYFFPVVLGLNTAKKIGMNEYLGMMIGAALCYPTINGVDLTFFGFNINATYTATFLPVICIVLLAKPLETLLNKVVPDVVKTFVTPMLVMLIAVPIGFTLIGPVTNYLGVGLSTLLNDMIAYSPTIAGLILGGFYQFIMLLGIHLAIFIPSITSLAAGVPDFPLALVAPVSFSQTAVVFAIWLKTKDISLKNASLPAWISGLFGVTEPAIYGVTLSRMKFFIISCFGAALSSGIMGLFDTKIMTMAGMGLFALPGFIDPKTGSLSGMMIFLLAIGVGMCFSFIATYVLFQDEEVLDVIEEKKEVSKETLASPVNGQLIPLSKVLDEAFAKETMGRVIALEPFKGELFSPVNGTIKMIYPSKHAIGILSENGAELLIHVGVDTVNLNGKFFEVHTKLGQKVKKGELLLTFEIDNLKDQGYSAQTLLIVTNQDDYSMISPKNENAVEVGMDVATLV